MNQPQLLGELETIFPVHPQIRDRHVEDLPAGGVQGHLRVGTGGHQKPHGGEAHLEEAKEPFIVVNEQKPFLFHLASPH